MNVSYQHQEPVKLLPFDKKVQKSSRKVKMTIFCFLSYITQNAIYSWSLVCRNEKHITVAASIDYRERHRSQAIFTHSLKLMLKSLFLLLLFYNSYSGKIGGDASGIYVFLVNLRLLIYFQSTVNGKSHVFRRLAVCFCQTENSKDLCVVLSGVFFQPGVGKGHVDD